MRLTDTRPRMDHLVLKCTTSSFPLLNCSRSVCEGGRLIRLIWLSSSARPPVPSTKPFGELTKVLVLVRKWKERWVRRQVDGWRYEQIGVDGHLERVC
ncbi:hypothetical protein ARMSODRAFT_453385 [Armillaria solidipes]|uniref:Uncharacterized protein n=1 Tax=Armillaria solidipes TaxID=1076256 RepID=A0A2H3B1W5_9AGAR|nr:hypothetical protein ARMSODRAFT_453385 [Armillaria solidipes]